MDATVTLLVVVQEVLKYAARIAGQFIVALESCSLVPFHVKKLHLSPTRNLLLLMSDLPEILTVCKSL